MNYSMIELVACVVCFGLGMATSDFFHERNRKRFSIQINDALHGLGITRSEFMSLLLQVERMKMVVYKDVAGTSVHESR